MKLSDFNYYLPKELIAQTPVKPRDYSRLMVLNRKTNVIKHDYFYNLLKYLKPGDVLVFNNTKVFPARLIGGREETGGKVEIFLLKTAAPGLSRSSALCHPCVGRDLQGCTTVHTEIPAFAGMTAGLTRLRQAWSLKGEFWEVLIGHKKKRAGEKIIFNKSLFCEIIKKIDESMWLVRFNQGGIRLQRLIDKLGQVPVPPYIKTKDPRPITNKLKNEYQTVYAKYRGSVAAPTAGFHFTKKLMNKLKKQGVQIEFVTMHVGLGTFQQVKVDNIKKHKMHAEWASIDAPTTKRLNEAKTQGRRIIAVGTTTIRTLEAFSQKSPRTKIQRTKQKPKNQNQKLIPQNKWVNIFIYPGYKFKFVDTMITNFHLPKSTLLMLVSAFTGRKKILKAYEIAKRKKYRFYSFGDAMLIV